MRQANGGGLARCSAGDQKAGAAWRPEADDADQREDRGRSQRNWLQKADKELCKAHRCIVSQRQVKGDVTSRVDLTCGKDHERHRKRHKPCLHYAIMKLCSCLIPADGFYYPGLKKHLAGRLTHETRDRHWRDLF